MKTGTKYHGLCMNIHDSNVFNDLTKMTATQ